MSQMEESRSNLTLISIMLACCILFVGYLETVPGVSP